MVRGETSLESAQRGAQPCDACGQPLGDCFPIAHAGGHFCSSACVRAARRKLATATAGHTTAPASAPPLPPAPAPEPLPPATAEAPTDDLSSPVEVRACVQGVELLVQRRNIEESDEVDPCFFDADYSVAASTGSLMWEGSWACIELLRDAQSWLSEALRGKAVVELGSGIGLLGLCAAAAGAHVLVTDVPAVVVTTLQDNVDANGVPPPGALAESCGTSHTWESGLCVGTGSVAVQPLNWLCPLDQQRQPNDPCLAEVILAAECVWLRDLVEPFVQTVAGLLSAPAQPPSRAERICILAFRERATSTSATFSTAEQVLATFATAGCEARRIGEGDAPESRGLLTTFYEIRYIPRVEAGRCAWACAWGRGVGGAMGVYSGEGMCMAMSMTMSMDMSMDMSTCMDVGMPRASTGAWPWRLCRRPQG